MQHVETVVETAHTQLFDYSGFVLLDDRGDAETVAERPSPSPSRGEMAFVMPVGSKGKATKDGAGYDGGVVSRPLQSGNLFVRSCAGLRVENMVAA